MQALMTTLKAILTEFAPTPPAPAPHDGRTAMLETLTLVVDDLTVASAALAAYLGRPGRAAEPTELEEAGLAQSFDVGSCHLLVVEPGSGTDAEDFLLAHGPGLYRLTIAGSGVATVPTWASPAATTALAALPTPTPQAR